MYRAVLEKKPDAALKMWNTPKRNLRRNLRRQGTQGTPLSPVIDPTLDQFSDTHDGRSTVETKRKVHQQLAICCKQIRDRTEGSITA